MPYHTKDMKPKNSDKLPSKVKQNIINKANLHHTTTKKMMKHANHHTKKHIDMMITLIKKKINFNDAHIETMKKIGA